MRRRDQHCDAKHWDSTRIIGGKDKTPLTDASMNIFKGSTNRVLHSQI